MRCPASRLPLPFPGDDEARGVDGVAGCGESVGGSVTCVVGNVGGCGSATGRSGGGTGGRVVTARAAAWAANAAARASANATSPWAQARATSRALRGRASCGHCRSKAGSTCSAQSAAQSTNARCSRRSSRAPPGLRMGQVSLRIRRPWQSLGRFVLAIQAIQTRRWTRSSWPKAWRCGFGGSQVSRAHTGTQAPARSTGWTPAGAVVSLERGGGW